MIKFRRLLPAIIVAASVTACGGAEPDSPARPTCNASAPTGTVFATEQQPDVPLTIQLPRLSGWQETPVEEGGETALRLGLRKGNATVTLRVLPATDTSSLFSVSMGDGWRQLRSETISVCGLEAHRTIGISSASGGEVYTDFLGSAYDSGEKRYPIMISAETPATDRATYQPEFDTILNGLQVVPRGTP